MSDLDRRSFLSAAFGPLGMSAMPAGRFAAFGQQGQGNVSTKPLRIDIHHHFGPSVWVAEVKGRPLLQAANTTWTPAKSIEDMDKGGVRADYDAIETRVAI